MESLIGKKIKNHKVIITDSANTTLKALAGSKGLVLYFYPRDNTPGCTTEACNFRDSIAKFKKLGFTVAGISADTVQSHQKFSQKKELNFPLIADQNLELCQTFGVYGEKKFMGKTHMGIHRRTWVLDQNLKVLLEYPKVKVKEHTEQVLADIKNLSL